ncbi:NAD(P)/FAD-dependent oxidoreductase [Streptomyces sp. NPDC127084]|uniref:NAD(P)/FAD-dependent oxidoreductase n=1 Tax=Streptomyces sp. NPDC127084 TaxID=3347133 RepID=UPI00364A0201
MYDAVIVGGRVAGSSTAMLLARAGHRVLVVDKGHFPSDTLSTHYIHQPGMELLARWGLLGALDDSGCPPIQRISLDYSTFAIEGPVPSLGTIRSTYAPRRYILDSLLMEAAVASGAEFRDHCRVKALVTEGNRVCGVQLADSEGRTETVASHLIVGADGMRSTVAQLTGAATYATHPTLTCAYYTYWSNLPVSGFQTYHALGKGVGATPTHDDLTLVVMYLPRAEFPRVRQDAYRIYLDTIHDTAPDLYSRLISEAHQVERLYGTGQQPNFYRQASGPGWVLVGDAGHHQDSITGWGMTAAFQQAQLLADLLPDTLSDYHATVYALKRFTELRDALLQTAHSTALWAAELHPLSEALLAPAIDDPAKTERLLSLVGGFLSTEEAFADMSTYTTG